MSLWMDMSNLSSRVKRRVLVYEWHGVMSPLAKKASNGLRRTTAFAN